MHLSAVFSFRKRWFVLLVLSSSAAKTLTFIRRISTIVYLDRCLLTPNISFKRSHVMRRIIVFLCLFLIRLRNSRSVSFWLNKKAVSKCYAVFWFKIHAIYSNLRMKRGKNGFSAVSSWLDSINGFARFNLLELLKIHFKYWKIDENGWKFICNEAHMMHLK